MPVHSTTHGPACSRVDFWISSLFIYYTACEQTPHGVFKCTYNFIKPYIYLNMDSFWHFAISKEIH